LGVGDVGFSRRSSFSYFAALIPEGPASTQGGEALAAMAPPNSSILSLEVLAEAGVGTFEDFWTASRTLAILLPFLGVVAGADANFDNPVMLGGLYSFGYSIFELFASAFSAGATVASTVTARIIFEAKGVASTYSTIYIFSVADSAAVFSKEYSFGLRVKTLALFGFDATEEDVVAIFLLDPCFRAGKQ
jgi:hypothetical protein